MSLIETLKSLIGYSGSDYDIVFAISSLIIIIYFLFTMFNILNALFKR